MGKITVKHYLNKRLKSSLDSNENAVYPVYVRIIYNQNSTSFPSEILVPPSITEERFSSVEIEDQKQYEVEIFTSILNFIENNKHDKPLYKVNSLVSAWKNPISDYLCDNLLPNKVIRDQIITYLFNFTKIDRDVVDNMVTYQGNTINALYKMSQYNIFDADISQRIKNIHLLSNYASLKFGDDPSRYGIKNSLCYFEWVNKNERDNFREYIIKNELLANADVDAFLQQIDNILFDAMTSEINFARYFIEKKQR